MASVPVTPRWSVFYSVCESLESEAAEFSELPMNLVGDLLGNEVRRRLLGILRDCDEPMRMDQLARVLAREIPSADHESLYVDLHHNHLPRLAEADLIAWDANSQEVQLTGRGDALGAAVLEARAGE